MSFRPRSEGQGWRFRVGAMRARVNIQTATDAVDSAGQPIRTWANTYTNEPANVEPTSGRESLTGRATEPSVDTVFTIHHRDSITAQMRVVYDSTNYGIVRVHKVEAGRRYIQLECKAIP